MDNFKINDHIKIPLSLPNTDNYRNIKGENFIDFLNDTIQKVNELQQNADVKVNDLAKGSNTDIHKTMISMEKAGISFKLMAEVRNKVISAYQEIMRMNV